MRILVTVKPNAKHEKVEELDSHHLKVAVNAPAKENKANEAVIRLLSKYFKVPKSRIRILKGVKSKQKLVEIVEDQ